MITLSEMNENVSFSLELSTGKLPVEIYDIPKKWSCISWRKLNYLPEGVIMGNAILLCGMSVGWAHVLVDAHMYFHSSCFVFTSALFAFLS